MKMSRYPEQAGLVTVELSISLLLLLLLLLATAEFGRLFYQYNELTKSVGAATRYLSEHSLDSAGVFGIRPEDVTIAQNLVLYGSPASSGKLRLAGMTPNRVQVSGDGANVMVSASWTYISLFGGKIPGFGLSGSDGINTALTLHASLAMRALN